MSGKSILLGAAAALSLPMVAHSALYEVGPGKPYATIQGAITAAAGADIGGTSDNTPSADPVEIRVYAGTYLENLAIPGDAGNKFNSQNDGWTIRNAPGNEVWLRGNVTVGIDRDNSVIDGINFDLSGGANPGINMQAQTTRNWTIKNGIIYGTGAGTAHYGYIMYGSNTLDHMTIYGTQYASSSNYASNLKITNSILANLVDTGLYSADAVENTLFFGNGGNGTGWGDLGGNLINVNPTFASTTFGSPDFLKLLPGSPAIGGASTPGQFTDGLNIMGARGVVPEPSSLVLASLGLVTLIRRRK